MRILVTGGAGFIGSNFIRFVLAAHPDYSVTNLDKLTYAGNLENLADCASLPNYRFVKGDICDAGLVRGLLAETDAVVHFAAESHVDRSIADSSPFFETNVRGTFTLLEAARAAPLKRFVHVSTDEVYGPIPEGGWASETSALLPSSPYSAAKAASDMLVLAYARTYGVPALITRAGNNYGAYQFPEKFIPLIISNALEDRPLPMYGDGLQVRDWLYVEDHCRALDLLLDGGETGEIYNIGTGRERTNLEVARAVLQLVQKPDSLIGFVKDRPAHDRRYALDCRKLEERLGWRPGVDFAAGIRRTVEWYVGHPEWVARVRDGAYREYYERHYSRRDESLAAMLSGRGERP
jgi:dTDP-glucose 4,6-dehydratase